MSAAVHPAHAAAAADVSYDGALQRAWETRRRLHAARASIVAVLAVAVASAVSWVRDSKVSAVPSPFLVCGVLTLIAAIAYRNVCTFKTWRRVASVALAILQPAAILLVAFRGSGWETADCVARSSRGVATPTWRSLA